MPDLVKDLKYTKEEIEAPPYERASFIFKGGEEEGLKRLMNYIWETKCLADYGTTRNQLSGENFSSKLSPWFAVGALSPRSAYFMARSFEEKYGHK